MKSQTDLEIWVKGVTSPLDAQIAIEQGVDGIIISNHGGRQLDTTPATIDILREIAPIAKGKTRIAIDGGFRRGSDIFKAVALGADFVFVGRIAIWGLAVSFPSANSDTRTNKCCSMTVPMVLVWPLTC